MNLLASKVYKLTKTMLHLISGDSQSSWSPIMEAQVKSISALCHAYSGICKAVAAMPRLRLDTHPNCEVYVFWGTQKTRLRWVYLIKALLELLSCIFNRVQHLSNRSSLITDFRHQEGLTGKISARGEIPRYLWKQESHTLPVQAAKNNDNNS